MNRKTLTLIYYLGFFSIGCALVSLGPILPQLIEQTSSDLGWISTIFCVRAFGSLVGAYSVVLMERFDSHLLYGWALILCALGYCLVPYTQSVFLLGLLCATSGLAMGFMDSAGNLLLMRLYDKSEVDAYVQALHFAFGLGAFVSPIVLNVSIELSGTYFGGMYLFSFLLFISGVPVLFFPTPRLPDEKKKKLEKRSRRQFQVVIAASLALFIYVGLESTFGAFIATIVIDIGYSLRVGQYVTALYWGLFTFGRFISIFLANRFSSLQLLTKDCLGIILSTFLLLFFMDSLFIVIISTVIYGLFMAGFFASVVSHCEHAIGISSSEMKYIMVGSACGDMVFPFVTGVAMTFDFRNFGWILFLGALAVGSIIFWLHSLPRGIPTSDFESDETTPLFRGRRMSSIRDELHELVMGTFSDIDRSRNSFRDEEEEVSHQSNP